MDTMTQGDRQSATFIESYGYLHSCCKNLLDRERLRVNRERVAEKTREKAKARASQSH